MRISIREIRNMKQNGAEKDTEELSGELRPGMRPGMAGLERDRDISAAQTPQK
jgi:hypothetical protein